MVRADRRQRLDLIGQARRDGFLGQRWKVETVIAVLKRKSGDTIRSVQRRRQRREGALKALVYNLHRLPCLLPDLLCNTAASSRLPKTVSRTASSLRRPQQPSSHSDATYP